MNVNNLHTSPSFVTKDTSVIREIMAPQNSAIRRQSLAEATIPIGGTTQAHYHPNTEEIYFILVGEGILAVEDERSRVVPGNAIGIMPGERHQITNAGDKPLVFLCCCAPAYTDTDTVLCEPLL